MVRRRRRSGVAELNGGEVRPVVGDGFGWHLQHQKEE
jgi:hypothetical protein